MAKTVTLKEWIDYLESRVGVDLYVWGGNGEVFVNQLPKLCNMEKDDHTYEQALNNTDRVLTLLQKRLLRGVDIFSIHGEDCSGLGIRFLLDHELIGYDTNANGLYSYTKKHGKEISMKDVKAGDFLFNGSADNKWHIGYAISERYAIECQDHDKGVVQTKISERPWKYATRPDWYSDSPSPEPSKPVLTRELFLTDPYMRGDDVKEAQFLLNGKGCNPGTIDGIFGKDTKAAVVKFQQENSLTADGIIGKKTATALGFQWEG